MTKVSSHIAKDVFRWRFLASVLHELPLDEVAHQVTRGIGRLQRSRTGVWFAIGIGAVSLMYWNGRLFVATGMGIGVMVLVYLLHDWHPRVNWAALQKLLDGWNQPFLVATGAGAIATFLTYLGASVWADADSQWIASGAILQSAGTLTVLLLLISQRLNRQGHRDRIAYNKLVSDLVHADPLRRLIAVRQLTDAVSVLEADDWRDRQPGRSQKPARHEIADYFRVMLQREEDAIVRDAIYEGLQTLDIVHQLKQATAPLIQLAPRQEAPRPLPQLTAAPQRTYHSEPS